MVATLLVISFALLLGVAASYAYQRRYSSDADAAPYLAPPPEAAGLFNNAATLRALAQEEARHAQASHRQQIIAQARDGVPHAALEAWAENDAELYAAACHELLAHAPHTTLADFWTQYEGLPVPSALVAAWRETCGEAPTIPQITQWLHLAARTGDAETLRQILRQMRAACPSHFSSDAGARLAASSYWLLPAQARNSGAGFVLRRELETLTR